MKPGDLRREVLSEQFITARIRAALDGDAR